MSRNDNKQSTLHKTTIKQCGILLISLEIVNGNFITSYCGHYVNLFSRVSTVLFEIFINVNNFERSHIILTFSSCIILLISFLPQDMTKVVKEFSNYIYVVCSMQYKSRQVKYGFDRCFSKYDEKVELCGSLIPINVYFVVVEIPRIIPSNSLR